VRILCFPRYEDLKIIHSNASALGYDTTANTIIFSSIILSLYGDIQDKMIEEIDCIYAEAEKAGRNELSFDEDLPKFTYVIAFMASVPHPNKDETSPNSRIHAV
jgi:hypothetical protein